MGSRYIYCHLTGRSNREFSKSLFHDLGPFPRGGASSGNVADTIQPNILFFLQLLLDEINRRF
ncbi:hypothetical protein P872_14265 [Rhodonellum psychrophilum GCM71 = DSM 17998]|uniref:Uncharacterized protein n=1 Tax=Rhodonellum psychrophilum GCM71 = DSM 17998 TaxID=1123057 RepID=U5BW83_9BACT|nr:hypothetical protein P872_14265 [Rhodonellum psychrophilum GCM71 = DSM 17998]